jgi:hypothetical protein
MRLVVALLALGSALAFGVSACGGGGGSTHLTKQEYVKQMQVIGHNLSDSLNSLGAAASNSKTAAAALTNVQSDLRNAADKLEQISPPDEIKDQQQKLATGVRDFAEELDPVIKKIRRGNLAALATLTTLKGVSEIQAASAAIAKKGYKIGA